jgi:hypothetical protein
MALFVVRHEHAAERCPAKDPEMGQTLLQHLRDASAAKAGINVNGGAVVNNEHALYLILEADARNRVQEFTQPFAMAGSVVSTRHRPVPMWLAGELYRLSRLPAERGRRSEARGWVLVAFGSRGRSSRGGPSAYSRSRAAPCFLSCCWSRV